MTIIDKLDRLSGGDGSSGDMEAILDFCVDIAKQQLLILNKIASSSFNSYIDSCELQSHAMSCISSLFCPAPDNLEEEMPILAKKWGRIKEKAHNHNDVAKSRLIWLIQKTVSQYRVETIRKYNPQGWKIRRALRGYIIRSEKYKMIRSGKQVLIRKIESRKVKSQVVPADYLRKFCFEAFSGKDRTIRLFEKAISILSLDSQAYTAIWFEDLAKVITEYHGILFSSSADNLSFRSADDGFLLSVEQKIIKFLIKQIKQIYLEKNKISTELALAYVKALKQFLRDLLNTGKTHSQKNYLEFFIPPEELAKNNKSIRTQFAYLIKLLRGELKKIGSNQYSSATNQKQIPAAS